MINQPYDRTKPYNQLPLLPPAEGITLDPEVLLKWGYASRALAELNRNILRLPNPTMLVNTISLQEAKSSSAIENIFTTDDELYKATSDTQREENASSNIKEVLRYREALWSGYQNVSQYGKLDINTCIQVYQQIKNSTQQIRPPQSLVVIKRGNSEHRPGEVIYTPPRGVGVIETLLNNLIEYLNDSQTYPTDPLIKMTIAHYQFEAIHPFTDGNGRTGRVLNLLYLVNQKLLSHPVLYLSKYIIDHKSEYYHTLQAVTQMGDWKKWILYMLTAVEDTAKYTNRIIDDIVDQMNATLAYGKSALRWYTKELNEAIFNQPYIKPKVIGEVLSISSRTTLTKYMTELVRLSILFPKEDWKEVFYLNNDLLRILEG